MFGAILGDIIGSPYEFDKGEKTKEFELFTEKSRFTDDTVMTLAVADALMSVPKDAEPDVIRKAVIRSMQHYGRKYPHAGYGGRFRNWLSSDAPEPYYSYGNGSAMRISSVGWMYDTWERTKEVAIAVTDVTHNHPEGIKGAVAVAAVIFFARTGIDPEEIKDILRDEVGYDLSRTVDEIRPGYHFDVSCQGSVPEAIQCFFEGAGFEDAVRNAVSIGGDTDTLGCMAGAMAEAMYGVPDELREECRRRLPKDLREVLNRFAEKYYPWESPELMKRSRISQWTDWNLQDMIPGHPADEYREMVEEGVRKDWPEALEALAYASYGGNSVFPSDWVRSRDCLLRLIEISEKPSPFWYNTLGYIYYYGRCNQGVPEYEKAFQYFSVGAWNGLYESQYKVADMLQRGNGVPKNIEAATNILLQVYSENKELLGREEYTCKFADAALRVGGLFERGIGVEQNTEEAFKYYLEALFAIEKRREAIDYYGDGKVEKSIRDAYERTMQELPPDFFRETIRVKAPVLLGELLSQSSGLDIAPFEKNGETYIVGKFLPTEGGPEKCLFTIPELKIVTLCDSVVMKINGLESYQWNCNDSHAYIGHIQMEQETGEWQFMYEDIVVLSVKCEEFEFG